MKTAKEFVERLQNDEAFAKDVIDAIQAKKNAGASDYAGMAVAVAAELGYEVTAEQVRRLRAAQTEEIGEEELGKAAGGTSCFGTSAVTIVTTTTTTVTLASSVDC